MKILFINDDSAHPNWGAQATPYSLIRIPRRAKYHLGQSKWALKQAARKILPDDIVFAPKRGFPLPGSFDSGCEVLLDKGAAGELLHWTATTTQALVKAAQRDARLRFLLVGVELWSRLTFHGERPQDLAEELIGAAHA